MLHTLIVQNKLFIRTFKNIRHWDYTLMGIFLLVFGIYFFFSKKLFLLTSVVILVFLFLIQEIYKRKLDTIDLYNLLIFPVKRKSIIFKYVFSDLLELKCVSIVIYLILVLFYNPKVIIFLSFVFIFFSFVNSLLNLIVKRYNTIYQIHRWTRTPISFIFLLPFHEITIGKGNSEIIYDTFKRIEGHVDEHIIYYSLLMVLICLLTYFCIAALINKVLTDRPLINDTIIMEG